MLSKTGISQRLHRARQELFCANAVPAEAFLDESVIDSSLKSSYVDAQFFCFRVLSERVQSNKVY